MRISLVSIAILFVWSAWAQLDSRSVSHDFGDILEKNGRVEHDFDIRNFGEDTIEIVKRKDKRQSLLYKLGCD